MATIDTIADRSTGSAIAGKAYFETSTNKFIVFNGTAWIELDSDGVGAVYENRWGASFDGSDYIDLGDPLTSILSSDFSLSVWFKLNNTTGTQHLLGADDVNTSERFYIYQSSGYIYAHFEANNQSKTLVEYAPPTLTNWINLVLTYSQNGSNVDCSMYMNGALKQSGSAAITISDFGVNNTPGDMYLGARNRGYAFAPLNGQLDEVAFFSSALSANQVSNVYKGEESGGSGGTNGVPGSLVTFSPARWYRMGDDSNDSATSGGNIATITDSSGNGSDATQSTASAQPTFSDLTGETIYV